MSKKKQSKEPALRSDDSVIIGVDLGGTKLLVAVLDSTLTVIGRHKVKTPVTADGDELLGVMLVGIAAAAADAEVSMAAVRAIGVSVPGPIDRKHGIVLDTVNIGVRNYPLRDKLVKALGIAVVLENDVNAGVYGEFKNGAAKGFQHVVGLYPGTGVGGGLVLDGRLYRGATGGAGELGHMIIQVDGQLCGCGQHGCLEAQASKTAIAKDLVMLAATGRSATVLDKAGTDIGNVRSSVIHKAMKNGEPDVVRVVQRAAWYLGIGMANCVNIFNPEVIVLGGGLVERFGDEYVGVAERSMREHAMSAMADVVKVVTATLGDDSVVTGAASLALETVSASEPAGAESPPETGA